MAYLTQLFYDSGESLSHEYSPGLSINKYVLFFQPLQFGPHMTSPRRDIVEPGKVGFYHCISRCVRRAFLCGYDKYSDKSFEHRKLWIRDRLATLVGSFAIELVSYAVLDNHLHTLVRTRPDIVESWTAEEVIIRWRRLFGKPLIPTQKEIDKIRQNPDLVMKYRERLSSISWFNRCLNEHIARRANAEDECTGRFWEGRFKCQRVSELPAVLLCATYIDLNPVRAGMAATPEDSDHTSIQDRIEQISLTEPAQRDRWTKVPLLPIEEISNGQISSIDYIKLVDETGRQIKRGKGSICDKLLPILERLKIREEKWLATATDIHKVFRRVVAPPGFMFELAERSGKRNFHGLSAARDVFIS